MKILSNKFSNAFDFIISGWANALKDTVTWRWLDQRDIVLDIFNEYQPDIYIGTTYDLTNAHIKALAKAKNCVPVLKAFHWGKSDEYIDKNIYPIGIADDKEKEITLVLKKIIQRQIYLFNSYHQDYVQETMTEWINNGFIVLGQPPGADITRYTPGDINNDLSSDICFIGGYWGYKGKNIDKYLLPLCYPVGKFNIKIFGNQSWPVPQYMGLISHDKEIEVFRSAKIGLNISEPHSTDFGFDLIERPFKLAACKTFCISDNVSAIRKFYNENELIISNNPEHMKELIQLFLTKPELRVSYIESAYNRTLKEHTYYHRMIDLMKHLQFNEIADKLYENINNWM
jgi:hypothetical protein